MAYCDHCNTQLPEGARYCFSCGKEVYQVKPRAIGSITHRDVVPYREERQDQNEEFVRITPSLVTAVPEAAALVLYGNARRNGIAYNRSGFSPQVELKYSKLFANIATREVKGKTYYVALFPPIFFYL